MAKVKRYNSKRWLIRQLYQKQKTPKQIAEECGVRTKTIYRKMKEFGIST